MIATYVLAWLGMVSGATPLALYALDRSRLRRSV